MVCGSHNTLGLDPSILEEVTRATTYMKENDLVKFGTGVHHFGHFSVQF
ncbi:hypothetical protein SAMN05518848_1011114 [Paenibacillus sp. PDC88]|nr:hypothetical protein SAMN05518848_1011114 [Paenibacillus sp. PDC88]